MTFEEWAKSSKWNFDSSEYAKEKKEIARAAWEAAKPEWRSIETAPKNTDILLFDGDKPYAKTGIYHVDGELTGWYLLDMGDELVDAAKQPTHWMPVPQPPEDQ